MEFTYVDALSLLDQCDHCYVSPWEILSIRGADTMDLLNRLLTLDTKRLEIAQGSWAFLLDHRGQVKQAMWLLKLSIDHFLAISETGGAELADALDMFVFSEDVHFSHLHESVCIYTSGNVNQVYLSQKHWSSIPIKLFNHQEGERSRESLLIGPRTDLSELQLPSLSEREFTQFRISLNGSLPSREYRSGTPLDVSRVGVSEGKGCYPGQEVIERTIALGKPAQVTIGALISLESSIGLNELLEHDRSMSEASLSFTLYERTADGKKGREIGSITSLAAPQSLKDEATSSFIALVKLKSRVAVFEDSLICYLELKENESETLLKISIKREIVHQRDHRDPSLNHTKRSASPELWTRSVVGRSLSNEEKMSMKRLNIRARCP